MELTELCKELRNWFDVNRYFGTFTIAEGSISLPELQNGQYFRIIGSVFNDGVYQFPTSELTDEVFNGAVWAMRVPPCVVALAAEIKKFNESEAAKPSAYTSESFGGYAYTKATNSDGAPIGWKTVFAKKLNQWRKL